MIQVQKDAIKAGNSSGDVDMHKLISRAVDVYSALYNTPSCDLEEILACIVRAQRTHSHERIPSIP